MHELAPGGAVERNQLGLAIDTGVLQPSEKFRGWLEVEEFSDSEGVVITGGLVVQHDVVGAGNVREVVAPIRCE